MKFLSIFSSMFFRFLLGILFLFSFSSVVSAEEKAQTNYFLVLSDIHFDPFITCYKQNKKPCLILQQLQVTPATGWSNVLAKYDQSLPQYKQDTNYELLVSALSAAKKAANAQHAKFVLVLGDFLGHDFRRYYRRYAQDRSVANYQQFVKKTLTFLNLQIAQAFPSTDVYMLVGNNDSYRHDYYAESYGAFFEETATLWSQLIKNSTTRAVMQKEFSEAGYYAVTVPNQTNLRIIMLNTVLFSNKAKGKQVEQAANKELEWLHKELQSAKEKHQRVIIAMHIPMGVDVYATLRIRLFTLIELWHNPYSKRFKAELKDYSPQIMAVFAGHLHSDWFQILTFENSSNEIPVSGVPAISPIFGNNPGFKIYSYSPQTLRLKDFVTYYYPINDKRIWTTEYDFNHIYQPNCSECNIEKGMAALQQSGHLADYYKQFYAVNTKSQPITTQWDPYYWCAIRQMDSQDYKRCLHSPWFSAAKTALG